MASDRHTGALSALAFVSVGALAATTQWNAVRIGSLALEDVLMVLAFALVLSEMIVHRRSVALPPAILVAACGLAIPSLVTALFPPSTDLTTNPLVQHAAALSVVAVKSRSNLSSLAKFEAAILLLPLLVGVVATTRERALRLADLWALGAIISGLVATTDLIGITHISDSLTGLSYAASRQSGLTVQSNHLALECVLVLPLVVMWLTRSRPWRIAGLVGITVLVLGIYASRSRAAEVLAPCALVFGFIAAPQLRPRFIAFAPLLALLGILTLLTFTGAIGSALYNARLTANGPGVAGSDFQRSVVRSYSVRAFEARPVTGVGYTVIDDAHDIYIQLLASGGLIALASFLVLIGGAFGLVRRCLRSPPDRIYGAALAAALVVWALNGVFGTQVTDRYLYVPVGVLVGLVSLQTARSVRAKAADTPSVQSHGSWAARPTG